jgi:hypothetical protein
MLFNVHMGFCFSSVLLSVMLYRHFSFLICRWPCQSHSLAPHGLTEVGSFATADIRSRQLVLRSFAAR